MTCSTPVVFLIFRRPDLTALVFEAIRQAQPTQLLVVADGPRHADEAELCQQARAVTEQVDWDCEVLRNYADVNLGCRKRVSSGLDWAFEQVEEAIVLEDDCLPHPSFFPYCQELLERYRDDERIWCISGNNYQKGQRRGDASYYFSNYNHCWGWASWRRAWRHYDHNLTNWPTFRDNHYLTGVLDSDLEVQYWRGIFERLHSEGKPNSWAYPWTFTCWQNRGLTALPNVNLVSNIGFGIEATHTLGESEFAMMPVADIGELQHPTLVVRNQCADNYTFETVFSIQVQKVESSRFEQVELTNSSSSGSVITEQISREPISPLTRNNHVELVGTLIVKELIEDWKNIFSIDISEEIISRHDKIYLFRCQETQLLFYYPFDIAGSENLYNSLSRFDWYYMPGKWEHNVALKSLKNSSRVLDVGCGYGAFIERLRQNESIEVIGIEQNKNAIEFASKINLPVFDLTLEQISENHKEYFDIVSAFQVLEHVTDPLQFLKDLITLIKPGGKLIISVPNPESFTQYANKNLLDQPPHHMHRWNKRTFSRLHRIIPIKLVKIKFEPLATYHVNWFLGIQRSRISENQSIRKVGLFILDRILAPLLKKSSLARRFVRGHTLYVEFIKEPLSS